MVLITPDETRCLKSVSAGAKREPRHGELCPRESSNDIMIGSSEYKRCLMFIKANDTVQVLAGDDKGKRGKVLRVLRDKNKVVVQGVNLVYRHLKPSRRNPQGGRLSKEMPIDVSNVALLDPSTNKPTRLGIRYQNDGTKELYAKGSGATIRVLSRPRKAYAKKR
jgi:large subunit ribosomal protein L24